MTERDVQVAVGFAMKQHKTACTRAERKLARTKQAVANYFDSTDALEATLTMQEAMAEYEKAMTRADKAYVERLRVIRDNAGVWINLVPTTEVQSTESV